MQRCQYCGSEFPDNARFCGNCGRSPVSNAAFSGASAPANPVPQALVQPPPGNRPDAGDEEEERRRGAVLPHPVPPVPGGSPVGGQVPQVQGTPSFSSVPTIQGTSSNIAGPISPSTPSPAGSIAPATPSAAYPAGTAPSTPAPSAPPGASPAGQPGSFEQHVPARSNAPLTHRAPTGAQEQGPPEQHSWWKQHQRLQRQQRHHEHDGGRDQSRPYRLLAGGSTKLMLIAIIALLVVAGGASALVIALRSQAPGPLTTGNGTPAGTNQNASATACARSGVPCTGTGTVVASPTAASGQATGTFNFTGAIPGPMVITSLPQCGVRSGSYFMQVKGTVGGSQYTFLIGLVSYHGPGTYTSNLTVNLIKVGTFVSMGNDSRLPVTITITNNGKAGTVTSDLIGLVSATQTQLSTGHVSGNWTCV